MKVYKTDEDLTLGNLSKGDLFEKDCNNPCTTYMVAEKSGFQPTGMLREDDVLVVDLANSLVRYLPAKTKVVPLEQTEGLGVRKRS